MNKIAAQRRINRPVDIFKLFQAKNPLRIEAVGIGDPVIDLGGGEAAWPRCDRRHRLRAGAGGHRRHR